MTACTAGHQNCMINTLEGLRERTYLVQCWVHPHSGKEVIDKNLVMEQMRSFLGHIFPDQSFLEEGVRQFQKEVDGLVLHPYFVHAQKSVDDPELEFMPRIRKENPEAKFASCQELPAGACP
jgi:hypothetical protein